MDVSLFGTGIGDSVSMQIDPTHMAGRVSIRPHDHIVNGVQGGHYALCATTGAISAIAAAGQIFSVRWNDPSKIFLLERLTVSAVCTAFSTGTGADLEAVMCHSFTANASGGAAITPSTTSQMKRLANMAPSSFNSLGEIRFSNSTAAITPGTQTLDTAGFRVTQLGATGAGGGAGPVDLFAINSPLMHPIVLTNNQGFVVRAATAVPSSNTFRYSVFMAWDEVAAY